MIDFKEEPRIIYSHGYINIYLRIFFTNSIQLIIFGSIFWLKIKTPLILRIIAIFGVVLYSLIILLLDFKFFLYKVEIQNSNIKLNFINWFKKNEVIFDLKTVVLSYELHRVYNSSFIKSNVYNLHIKKNKKESIIEIMPGSGWFTFTKQEKIKALYDILISLQKELLNDNDGSPFKIEPLR